MDIKRRQFLGAAVASTAGTLLPGQFATPAVAGEPASMEPTAVVPLGRCLKACRLGIGFGVRSSNRQSELTRKGADHFHRVVQHAYDQGVRLFDQADLYGSHQLVAKALAGKPRESYVISSKLWFHPHGLPQNDLGDADTMVERFLREMQTDYIDLVQIHCMTSRTWTTEMRKQMDLLEGLKAKGTVRAHGVSCHSIPALEAAAEEPWVDVVHARINPYGTKMDGPADEVVPVLRKIHDAGKGVIGMKIIGEGAFRNSEEQIEKSLRFALGLGCVDAMVVGFEEPHEIDDLKARVARALVG